MSPDRRANNLETRAFSPVDAHNHAPRSHPEALHSRTPPRTKSLSLGSPKGSTRDKVLYAGSFFKEVISFHLEGRDEGLEENKGETEGGDRPRTGYIVDLATAPVDRCLIHAS